MLRKLTQEVWGMSNPNGGGGMGFMGVVMAILVALFIFFVIG